MPNIELLVEAIRARIDTLKSDPDLDDATRANLEILEELLERLEAPPLWASSTGPTLH